MYLEDALAAYASRHEDGRERDRDTTVCSMREQVLK